jgi:hypothetical protein
MASVFFDVSHVQDATKLEYSHYVKYIEERFPPEVPQMFGLPPAENWRGLDSTFWNLGTIGKVKNHGEFLGKS